MRGLLEAFLAVTSLTANAAQVLKPAGKASFEAEAVVLGADVDFTGEGAPVAGSLSVDSGSVTGTLEVELAALTTGMSMRDDHMKEMLDVKAYPKAKLVLDKAPFQVGEVPFSGQLTLKAESHFVSGFCTVKSLKPAAADCRFKFKLSDYKTLVVPGSVAAKLKDEVTVKASLKAAS